MIGGGAGIFVFALEELILEARGEMCWKFRKELNRSTEPVLEPKTLWVPVGGACQSTERLALAQHCFRIEYRVV